MMCQDVFMEDGTRRESGTGDVAPCPGPRDDTDCPVRSILDRIGDKWAVSVVEHLAQGTTRFSVLKREIDGISQRMLTETLRKLERDGMVERTMYPTIPPKVEYALTDMGRTLVPAIEALIGWALSNRTAIQASRMQYDAHVQHAEQA